MPLYVYVIISFTIVAVSIARSSLYVVSNIYDIFYKMYVNDSVYL
jgi:hypothetical protein